MLPSPPPIPAGAAVSAVSSVSAVSVSDGSATLPSLMRLHRMGPYDTSRNGPYDVAHRIVWATFRSCYTTCCSLFPQQVVKHSIPAMYNHSIHATIALNTYCIGGTARASTS